MSLGISLDRREFLKLGGTVFGSTFFPYKIFDTPKTASDTKVVKRYTIPNSVESVNIEKIINALVSGKTVGEGDYIPDFANITNYVHKELTTMTYQKQMKRNFDNGNPIEIVILKGLESEKGKSGYFSYDDKPGNMNQLFVDSNLKPPTFANILPIVLAYSIFGPLDLAANAHAHRNVSYTIARFPELIREKDSECVFMERMMSYVGKRVQTSSGNRYKIPIFNFVYLVLLNHGMPATHDMPAAVIDLDDAIELSRDGKEAIYQVLLDEGLTFLKYDKLGYVNELIDNFTRKTLEYILKKNPKMPDDKLELLKKKIERAKNSLRTIIL